MGGNVRRRYPLDHSSGFTLVELMIALVVAGWDGCCIRDDGSIRNR